MSARIYWGRAWHQVREQRAIRGKAPRLAIRRAIVLQQSARGRWIAGIHEWRFGKWTSPSWLCGWDSLPTARSAALRAWEQYRLPLLWAYYDERGTRPFYRDLHEPRAVRS